MAKEILFYSSIYSYSAANFINEIEANRANDICVRGNCPGGDMFSTYGMQAKFQEHPKGKKIKVDGIAASAFAYMLLDADEVECLDVSQFLYHRAVWGSPEDEKDMQDSDRKILDSVNSKIRTSLESKASSDTFKAITGTSYDELFAMDKRIDVILNATQAKQLGIVQKITPLTASKKSEIIALAANYNVAAFTNTAIAVASTETQTKKIMNAAEFKAAHPEAYAQIIAEGVSQEKDRVKSWMAWNGVDPEAVTKAIADDSIVTPGIISEMSVKAVNKASLVAAEKENAADVKVPDANTKMPTADEKANADAKAEFMQLCGIKPKK